MSKHSWYFRKRSEQLYDGKLGTTASDIMYVKPFIYVVAKWLLQYLLKRALYLSSSRLKCIVKEMYSPRKKCLVKEIRWELTKKILLLEICASYESLMKRYH